MPLLLWNRYTIDKVDSNPGGMEKQVNSGMRKAGLAATVVFLAEKSLRKRCHLEDKGPTWQHCDE